MAEGAGFWFRVHRALVESGAWADLHPSARAVLIVLYSFVNEQDLQDTGRWVAWPGRARIAKLAGIDRGTVPRAVQQLEAAGLIFRAPTQGGKPSNTCRYEIVEPGAPARPVAPAPPVAQALPDAPNKAEGARGRDETGRAGAPQKRLNTQIEKQQIEDTPAAAESERLAPDNLRALYVAGVGEPKASELAKLSGVTPGLIRELAARPGKGPGALVLDLPARAAAELDRSEERARAEQAERVRRAERARAVAKVEADASSGSAITQALAGADPADVERASAAVLSEQPAARRDAWSALGFAGAPKWQRLTAQRLGLAPVEVAA